MEITEIKVTFSIMGVKRKEKPAKTSGTPLIYMIHFRPLEPNLVLFEPFEVKKSFFAKNQICSNVSDIQMVVRMVCFMAFLGVWSAF